MTTLCETKSQLAYKKACEVMPGGVSSPARAFMQLQDPPLIIDAGYLDEIIDIDERSYIDYCASFGALLHGHAHPQIVEVVQKQVAKGSSFSISTPSEERLARKIVQHIPSVEKVRFVSSGTEATMTALRLARGFTKRNFVIKFIGNYHGHSDPFLVRAGSAAVMLPSSLGVPPESIQHTLTLPYNDREAVRAVMQKEKVAAIIVEPIAGNMGLIPPAPGFLELLREETTKQGALLIFDEVITGFRVGLQGAQGLYGITPDLTTLGKVIGGGFPVGAVGARAEIMDLLAPLGPVYQAGTLSGNPVAMEAGIKALELAETKDFYAALERKTRLLTEPLQEYIVSQNLPLHLEQLGSLFTLFFGKGPFRNFEDVKGSDHEQFKHLFSHLLQKGIYLSPSSYELHFVTMAHSPAHLTYTADTIIEYLDAHF